MISKIILNGILSLLIWNNCDIIKSGMIFGCADLGEKYETRLEYYN